MVLGKKGFYVLVFSPIGDYRITIDPTDVVARNSNQKIFNQYADMIALVLARVEQYTWYVHLHFSAVHLEPPSNLASNLG